MDYEPQNTGALNEVRSIQLDLSLRERLPQLRGGRLAALMALAFREVELRLGHAEALSVHEIAEQTGLSPRHAGRAVRFLVEQHLATPMPPGKDRRERRYRIAGYAGDGNPALCTTPMSTCAPEAPGTGTPMSAPAPDLPGTTTCTSAPAPVVVVNTTSKVSKIETTTTKTRIPTSVRAILSDAGIWGNSLNRLAATVAPELAERWALWIRWAQQEATDRYPSPAGLARFWLLKDPTKEPDSICPIPEGFDPCVAPGDPPVELPVPEADDAGFAAAAREAGGELTAQSVWRATVAELRLAMTKATFETWVRPTVGQRWDGGVLVVRVHSPYAKEWLEQRLQTTVHRALSGILERPVEIRYEPG